MKRADLERKIRDAARARRLTIVVTHGRRHDKVVVGDMAVIIPRHREINEFTARGILRTLGAVLGDD